MAATGPGTTVTADAPTETSLWLASTTLWRREIVRFVRDRSRVVGALLTPLLFWLVLGSGLDRSFVLRGQTQTPPAAAGDAAGFLEYLFPGMVVMVLLFTAIFTSFSVIEDRREGFYQAVLAAPVPRLAIVLGKVLGGATLGTIQGAMVMLIWPFLFDGTHIGAIVVAVAIMFVLAVGLMGLCLCMAWRMDSTAGFHVVMNLILIPLWFLSGAVFPASGARVWIQVLMYANPLTYGQAMLRSAMQGQVTHPTLAVPQWAAATIMGGFTVAILLVAVRVVSRTRKDGAI